MEASLTDHVGQALTRTPIENCLPQLVNGSCWPIHLLWKVYTERATTTDLCNGMQTRAILVLGGTIKGWCPLVPDFYLHSAVVVMLKANLGSLQYGWRDCIFTESDENTWQHETTAMTPCIETWKVIDRLIELGANPYLSCL